MLDIDALITDFIARGCSDIYLTVGAPPCFRGEGGIEHVGSDPLTDEDIRHAIASLVSEQGAAAFSTALEYDTGIDWKGIARLRINIFRQRQHSGMVVRRIRKDIPDLKFLGLSDVHSGLIMEKRGLVLVAGATGSGKSTTLASMINYRNNHGHGHILTIEDPVEFIHEHRGCIFTQRDIGIDTLSYATGLKSALRQMPDVIVIGEIRDMDTMEQAMMFAETGHLCLATLHASNATQAIERVVNLFPEAKQQQVLLSLSSNLKAILSQRLVRNLRGHKSLATEILLNQGLIRDLIAEGRIKQLKEIIEKNKSLGMQTFEQSLLDLFAAGVISEEAAMAEADSPANLRIAMRNLTGLRKSNEFTELQQQKNEAEKKNKF